MTEFEGELESKFFFNKTLDLRGLLDDVLENEGMPQEVKIGGWEEEDTLVSFFIKVDRERGVRYVYFQEFNHIEILQKMKDLILGPSTNIEPHGFKVRYKKRLFRNF